MFAQWNEISRQVSNLVSNDDGSVDADSYLSDSSVSSLNDELLSVLGNSYSEFYERSKPVIRRLASMTHGTVARCRLSKRKFAGTSNYFFNKMTNNEAHALQLYANTVSFIHFGCKKLESEIVFMVHLDKMEKMLTEGLCQILSELCNLIGQIQAGEYPVTDEKTRVRLVPVYSTLTVRNDVVQNIQKIDKKMLDEESARSTGSSSSVSANSIGEDSNEEARTPSPPHDVPKSHLLLIPTPRPSETVKGNESANRDMSNRTLGIEEESEDEDPFAEERVQTAVSPIGIEDVSFDKRDETDEVEGEEEDTLGFMELSSDAQTKTLDTLTRRLREIRERTSELREASPDTMSSASSSPPDILNSGGSSPARELWIDKLEEGLSEVTGLHSPTSTRKADKNVDGEVNKVTTLPEQDTKFQTFLKSMDDDTKWKNKAIPPPFLLHHPHFALRHKTPKLLLKPSKGSEVQKESEKEEERAREKRQTVADKLATLDFVECEAQKVDRDVKCAAVARSPPPPRKVSVDPCDTSIGHSDDQLLQPIGGIPPEERLFPDIGDLSFDAVDPPFLTTGNSVAETKINKGAVSPKKCEPGVVMTTTPEKPKEKVRIGTPPPKSYTPGGRPRRFSLDTSERTSSTKDSGRSPVKRSLFNSLSQSPPRDENLQVDEFPQFADTALPAKPSLCLSPSKGVKSIPYGSPPPLGDSLLSSPSSKASPLKISPLSFTSPLSVASPRSATLQQIPEAEEGSATQFFANETTNVKADSPTKADRSPSVVTRTESGSPLKTLFQLPFRNKRVSGVKDSSPVARSTVSSGSKSPAKKKQNTFLRNLFPTRGSSNPDTSDSNC